MHSGSTRAHNVQLGQCNALWRTRRLSLVDLVNAPDTWPKRVYTLTNPVTAGLVPRSAQWHGVRTQPVDVARAPAVFKRLLTRLFRRNGLPAEVELRLAVPSALEQLSRRAFAQEVHGSGLFLGFVSAALTEAVGAGEHAVVEAEHRPEGARLGPGGARRGRLLTHGAVGGLVGFAVAAVDGALAARGGATPLTGGGLFAAMGLAVGLFVPLALAGGAMIGLVERLSILAGVPERLLQVASTRRGRIGGLAFFCVGGVGAVAFVATREIDWAAVDWWGPGLLVASIAAYLLGVRAIERLPTRTTAWTIAGVVCVSLTMTMLASQVEAGWDAALHRIGMESRVARHGLRLPHWLADGDGDGHPTVLCGQGCDCDDADPAVHPMAAEVVDNGIDEDCSGADLSRAEQDAFAGALAHVDWRGEAPSGEDSKSSTGTRPHVLLITIDTVRADHLGTYGYERATSPRIDAWAAGGVVFEQARATGPATRFSVPPMLVGKYLTEIRRTRAEWPRIRDEEVLLAERFDALGYATAAFHSIRYFRRHYGLAQGVDHHSEAVMDASDTQLRLVSSEAITDEALEWLDGWERKAAEPFFLWAYYGDPHSEYIRHPGFSTFGPRYRDLYDGEIAFTDHHIGRLLDGLAKRGLLDDTVVMLHSDHGEALDPAKDHGSRYHSGTLYDELVRVPFIISGPGFSPGRVTIPVSLIDVVPTFVDLLGQPPDDVLRGVSLVPYLHGERPPHPPVFFEKHRAKDDPQKGMVAWPYKVILAMPYNRLEIYDLSTDPLERRNLVRTLPRTEKRRLVGLLRHWANRVLKPVGGARH